MTAWHNRQAFSPPDTLSAQEAGCSHVVWQLLQKLELGLLGNVKLVILRAVMPRTCDPEQ